MSDAQPDSIVRRGFLGRLLGGSLAVAAASVPAAPLLVESRAGREPGTGTADAVGAALAAAPGAPPDMSWVNRITAERRMAFDAAAVDEGAPLHQVRIMLANYADIEHTTDADWSIVLTIRHDAVPMIVDDSIWAKYKHVGTRADVKDPAAGKHPTRNPFLNRNVGKDDRYAMI